MNTNHSKAARGPRPPRNLGTVRASALDPAFADGGWVEHTKCWDCGSPVRPGARERLPWRELCSDCRTANALARANGLPCKSNAQLAAAMRLALDPPEPPKLGWHCERLGCRRAKAQGEQLCPAHVRARAKARAIIRATAPAPAIATTNPQGA